MAGGKKVAVGPGHINLIEDTTGKGHITHNLGPEDRIVVTIRSQTRQSVPLVKELVTPESVGEEARDRRSLPRRVPPGWGVLVRRASNGSRCHQPAAGGTRRRADYACS